MTLLAFLVAGSLLFVGCILLPQTRRFALSAALWCAMWGPCAIALMTLAGLGLVASNLATQNGHAPSLPWLKLLVPFGKGYVALGVVMTIAVATAAAWIHQALIHRFTFPLFRLYAAAVCAGIGSVFGLCLGWWIVSMDLGSRGWAVWVPGMVALIAIFGVAGYRYARALRGEAPANYTWITRDEFAGHEG